MVYSKKYNFIYLHTPRTGGASIQKALSPFLDEEYSWCSRGVESYLNHMSSSQGKEYLGDHIWNNSFKFAFVRNPFTWWMSGFYSSLSWSYPKEGYSILINEDKYIPIPDNGVIKRSHVILRESLFQFHFQEYVRKGLMVKELLYGNEHKGRDDNFFESHVNQSMWASNEVDFIGRFENLQSDFNHICRKVGLGEIELEHLNSDQWSERSFLELSYSKKAKELVGILYEEDLVNFGYKKRIGLDGI